MEHIIANMLSKYERGMVSRRQLINALTAVVSAATAEAAPAANSTFQGVGLNHIAIRVTSIPRSRDFYQKHFGLPLLHEAEDNCFLGLGKNFLTFFRNEKPGLDHFCIAIESFNANTVMEQLKRQELKPTRPTGSDRVYFPDPDGLEIQLSAIDHHA
jgi:catechol 2,3-dioxygenase-like lactoylglutathione lyase family enzyme